METRKGMMQDEAVAAACVVKTAAAGRINVEIRRRDYEVGDLVVTDYSVVAVLRDAHAGDVVVRELMSVPSADEASALVSEMRAELAGRGRKVAIGRRIEREMGH